MGEGQVGAQPGGGGAVLGVDGRSGGDGCSVVGLAAAGGVDVLPDSLGVDQPSGNPGGFGHSGEGDRRPRRGQRLDGC